MSEAKIVGPTPIRPGGDGYVLKLVQGDKVLGELIFLKSTGTVFHVRASSQQVHDYLIAEAKRGGLLHGKDIPDHLQHDREHI